MFRILFKKKQDEILKRVTACQIIAIEHISNPEAYEQITENLADIAIGIGGAEGGNRVLSTIHKYMKTSE